MLTRRTILATGAVLAAPGLVRAQTNRVTTLISPFPPGGSTDLMARLIAERLTAALGRSVIVENQSGAGGRLAARAVQTAPPDGTKLLLANTSVIVMTPLAFADAGYDPLAFVPVAGVAEFAIGLASGPMTNATDMAGLLAWLRANPGRANIGIPALGSLPHLIGVALQRAINLPLTVVPYRGGAPIAQDLIGGQIPVGVSAAADFATLHGGRQLRLLAVTGTARAPGLSDVATFSEQGLPGFEANAWNGIFASPGTPSSIVAPISAAIREIVSQPDVRRRLEAVALSPIPVDGETIRSWITRDRATYAPLIAAAGPLQ